MRKKDITSLVQRLDAFEERVSVRIDALSAFESKDRFSDGVEIIVRGELHTTNGTKLQQNIYLELAVYDSEGRVIDTSTSNIRSRKFFAFQTFEITCSADPGAATKLRLIPRPE